MIILRDLIITKVFFRGCGSLNSWDDWQAFIAQEVTHMQIEPIVHQSRFHNSLAKMKLISNLDLPAFDGRDTKAWLRERPDTRPITRIYQLILNAEQVGALWVLFRQVRRAASGYESKQGRQMRNSRTRKAIEVP